MEFLTPEFELRRNVPWDCLPKSWRRRVFGVEYVCIDGLKGGELYLTRHGWAVNQSLLPKLWHDNQRFRTAGRAMQGATGSVYCVPVPHKVRSDYKLIVKFSRFAQHAGVTAAESGLDDLWPLDQLEGAEFLSPFEEIGALAQLRRGQNGAPRIATKIPLGIYCPATRYAQWELGRESARRWRYDLELARDQDATTGGEAVQYAWDRLYALLYQYVEGIDAEQAFSHGLIDEATMVALARTAARDLRANGWAVLDHKPRHVILRTMSDGRLVRRRDGRPYYALIDYELLVPLKAAAPQG